jgi:hypothetical protein
LQAALPLRKVGLRRQRIRIDGKVRCAQRHCERSRSALYLAPQMRIPNKSILIHYQLIIRNLKLFLRSFIDE